MILLARNAAGSAAPPCGGDYNNEGRDGAGVRVEVGVSRRPLPSRLVGPPRMHHYLFAHRHLRAAFFEDPTAALTALCGPDAAALAARLWEAVGAECSTSGHPVLPPEGLAVRASTLADRAAAVVALPDPTMPSEAWFVALVEASATDGPRYLTLEKSVSFAAEPAPDPVMLCEWTADGTHVNYGPTSGHALERFEALAEARLR